MMNYFRSPAAAMMPLLLQVEQVLPFHIETLDFTLPGGSHSSLLPH